MLYETIRKLFFIANSVPIFVIIRLDRIIQFFFFWIARSSRAMTEPENLKQLLRSLKINSIIFGMFILSSCAPVLRQDVMETGIREFSLSDLRNNPDIHKGKLFILGGSIVSTKITQEGSQVEALYIPVDSRGYLKDVEPEGRFFAILTKERGILDPLIYRKGRFITVAGEFTETRSGKIDEVEYIYPVFEIVQIYLWRESRDYYYQGYYYPYSYPYPSAYSRDERRRNSTLILQWILGTTLTQCITATASILGAHRGCACARKLPIIAPHRP